MRRAKELESYDPNSEFAVDGEEGWFATHADPHASVEGGGTDSIPCIDKRKAKEDEDDIPDMSALEIAAEDDEVTMLPRFNANGT